MQLEIENLKNMKHKNKIYIQLSGAITFLLLSVYVVFTQNFRDEKDLAQFAEKPGGFQDYFKNITIPIGAEESGYIPGYRVSELEGLKKRRSVLKSSFSDTLIWQPRGPYNVGGRAISILVDPDDPTSQTWYAGTAGGGIWKTVDAGQAWTDMTPELPNLATVALAMAESNHDLILAGTGEGFGGIGMITGDGLFKSTDRGESWSRIESTKNPDFYYINDICISPTDEDVILLATNTGLYKTIDGGDSWDTVYQSGYRVQDLQANPEKASTIYAAVNTIGIIKSYDSGNTWQVLNQGIIDAKRLSIAVSPADTSYVFASGVIISIGKSTVKCLKSD